MARLGHMFIRSFLLISIILCASACQMFAPPRSGPLDEWEEQVSGDLKAKPTEDGVPSVISEALLPPIETESAETLAIGDEQRFDISVSGAPAEQFFMSLVEGTPYNMVVHPEVTGAISLNLKNVTIPEVMDAVRDVYGFQFVRTPYGFQVLPGQLGTRIYQVNFLNIERTGTSSTFVSSGSLTTGGGAVSASVDDVTPTQTGLGDGGAGLIGTSISTRQPPTSFWDELKTSIEAIVGGGEGRSVVINPQSGVVVVRALPNELREVESFLLATQLIVQRQVILETKILEVALNDEFQSGINWAAVIGNVTIGQTGGGTAVGPSGTGRSDIAGETGDLDPGSFTPIASNLASAFGGIFTLAVNRGDFKAFVELLELQGNVQVLSSPRIATLNNQKAVIKVGRDEFFVTDVSTTTITGTTTTSTPNIELTPFFSGVALDVTPQISDAGEVTLHIHPSVTRVQDQQKTIEVGGFTQVLPLALSQVRESDSIVRAQSGQLVVIGGLMEDVQNDEDAQTPGFGDVPIFGALFRQRSRTSTKTELVILLRPIIVEGGQQWADALQRASQSFQHLRQEVEDSAKINPEEDSGASK
ncbi:MAG: pilus (MSHA type) biogenesis protein MshL [Gammaproteobacteria bacterium]|nr:pilus (MSHA type) biogenesis protein MshL [Gammaproteobacteria bacterium]MCI0590117.1 pilus (MSHA type) biogenesis protein MshL [Gammaproteobacteria bacterium]